MLEVGSRRQIDATIYSVESGDSGHEHVLLDFPLLLLTAGIFILAFLIIFSLLEHEYAADFGTFDGGTSGRVFYELPGAAWGSRAVINDEY